MGKDIDEDSRRQWHLESLKQSLQALAIPALEQLALFPDFVCKSDELALDFDHWRRVVVANYVSELSRQQQDALDGVDAKLSLMSRNGAEFSDELWTDEAVQADARWAALRVLAIDALAAFEWPLEAPPRDPSARGVVYVGGP